MITALEGGERSASHSSRSLTPRKTRYPLYKRLGAPQGRSGQMQKISPPPTRIRSPDRPARSQSLYHLRYLAHKFSIHLLNYSQWAFLDDISLDSYTVQDMSFKAFRRNRLFPFSGKTKIYPIRYIYRLKPFHSYCSTIALEDGTDREFRNVGVQ